ncbi:sulfite exporter TauE/SafE family protein [Bacillus infantis]|nr:sulfite exporter TauE/SafE family protein [Bacillus sp. UMB0728]RYI29309.1 sulfite exporter TauE/SafE family protein [Bacillus infantis]
MEKGRKSIMAITLTMLLMGMLLGFIGAGGAGFIIAILTLVFDVPIHIALGTSLTAMIFTSLSGAYSHYREGNMAVKAGLVTGIAGAFGAYGGSQLAAGIPVESLHWLTAGMLFLSSILLMVRLYITKNLTDQEAGRDKLSVQLAVKAVILGLITGVLSGTFGIGSTPFIQLGLLIMLGLTIRQSIGTTMLVILPIAAGGGLGYQSEGYLDYLLLLQVLLGTMTGAYIGAKFTGYAPKNVLKASMILTPAAAGLLLLFPQ